MDNFVQKFLSESLQRIKQKFLPEIPINHLSSDKEAEHIHDESCKILSKITIPNNWAHLRNESAFQPGIIPEDKPIISTQSQCSLNPPKEVNKKHTLNIGNKWNNGNKNNRGHSNAQAKSEKVAKKMVEHPKKIKNRCPLKNRDTGVTSSSNIGKNGN